ncbi:MAG: arylsulfatase [Rubripirellula sp.]
MLFVCLLCVVSSAADPTRPNVIFMMADDMGMGDTSAYQDFTGNSDQEQVETPNMERLSRMGVRFTDAHTPSTRCSPTRYGLLTGRYPWRNRLKHWVLFGVQGDPMIEADRPTLATLMKDNGYRTAMVGKWHVGLRYRNKMGSPASAWNDADLRQPMFDTPLDHGFDFCRFTSRSHGTSGPARDAKAKNPEKNKNWPGQTVGPGHVHGRDVVAATGNGKQLLKTGPDEYLLHELGGRHWNHAKQFLNEHLEQQADKPFFLYYPSNSNHGPYTPTSRIDDRPVKAFTVSGDEMDVRHDYVYENDVVLGLLMDYLQNHDDPRNEGHKLIENTIVVFTSDNGAEKDSDIATGPFRSHKGSCYEGGHRVPFLVSWPAGGVGDGDDATDGQTNSSLIGLHDMFATFADLIGTDLPDWRAGQPGAEDSTSVLTAWLGETLPPRPMFFHDHKQAKKDHAVAVLRLDDPTVNGDTVTGQWKMFFDPQLLRGGTAKPFELYDLATDPQETNDLLESADEDLLKHLTSVALEHRNAGGHRLANEDPSMRFRLHWVSEEAEAEADPDPSLVRLDLREQTKQNNGSTLEVDLSEAGEPGLIATVIAKHRDETTGTLATNLRGLGINGGNYSQVDSGEYLDFRFNRDVLIESAAIIAGNGVCGGFYRVGDRAPLAIYCVDADIDEQDQSGILSDIGVLKEGESLRLESSPHHGVESPGRWRLQSLTIRALPETSATPEP